MRLKRFGRCLLIIFLLIMPGHIFAQDNAELFDFNILLLDDYLTVKLNLEPFISSSNYSQMKDGIDLAIQYDISLVKPKKFWGSKKIINNSGVYRIGYQMITKNYYICCAMEDSLKNSYNSLATLSEFLADSVIFKLIEKDSLDIQTQYYISFKISCISMTSLNLPPDNNDKSETPIKYLFKKFLDITNFGREEFEGESRLFFLSELSGKP